MGGRERGMRIRVWGTMALPCMLTEQATVVLARLYSTDQSGGGGKGL